MKKERGKKTKRFISNLATEKKEHGSESFGHSSCNETVGTTNQKLLRVVGAARKNAQRLKHVAKDGSDSSSNKGGAKVAQIKSALKKT